MKKIALAILAVALLGGCALPGSSDTSSHACADKVVAELLTNQTQHGLWACLDSDFQKTLHTFGQDGDGAFVTPGAQPPPVISHSYVGAKNGVEIYTIVGRTSTGRVLTLVLIVYVDADGKVSNFGVAGPTF